MMARLAPTLAVIVAGAFATTALAQGGRFAAGQIVLGAPGHIEAAWTRCQVGERIAGVAVGGERAVDSYKLQCVSAHPDIYGRPVQTISEGWVKETWMKPDDPSFHPEWRLAVARGQEAAHSARAAQMAQALAASNRPKPPAPVGGVPRAGSYECWANGYARMNLNFRVTGPGAYRNDSGTGRFTVGADGKTIFTGPMMASMPDGFIVVFHQPGGKPTFSFRSPRGAEAAFCEHAGA